jgi:uncharacterized protein
MRYLLLAAALIVCSCGSRPTNVDDFYLRSVTLPGGRTIHVETASDNVELLRGLMFRTSLAPDRGMLFVYPRPNRYEAVMYQVQIPLDIIWMDTQRRILEIDDDATPCNTQASKCPKYGGNHISLYALEIPGGMAQKYGLQVGQVIQW